MDLKVDITRDGRKRAGTCALIGDGETLADPQCKGRIEIKEECSRVIVVEEHQCVGLLLSEPSGHRLVTLEQRRPCRVRLLALFEGQSDGWHMGCSHPADDSGHTLSLLRLSYQAITGRSDLTHTTLSGRAPAFGVVLACIPGVRGRRYDRANFQLLMMLDRGLLRAALGFTPHDRDLL